MRRSDPLTLTITVLSTVAVTSGLTLGLGERYVTSYRVQIHIVRRCSTTSHTVSAIDIRMTLLPDWYVFSMIVCITANRTYYRSDLV